jgi:ATP-dependent RNA helicase DDX24/MAK5
MSRTGEKRAISAQALEQPRKKRKVKVAPEQRQKIRPPGAAPNSTLSANELNWKEVTPPDRLDDAEGFFGLEEIDDVEVIRDDQGKQACFKVCLPSFFK